MRRSFMVLAFASLLVLVAASCSEKKDTGFPPPPPSPTESGTHEACTATTDTEPHEVTEPIEVGDSFFAPIAGSVKAGAKIDWKQCGVAPHTVTFSTLDVDSHPDCPKDTTKCMAQNDEFSTTIAKAGKYHYYCKLHGVKNGETGMYGYIVVT